MSTILSFFQWLYRSISRSTILLTSGAGQIALIVGAAAAAATSMFSRFSYFETSHNWITEATASVRQLLSFDPGSVGSVLLYWFSIDRLVQIMGGVLTLTVGVTVLIFVTIFGAVFAIVPTVLAFRAILKAIKTATVGILDP